MARAAVANDVVGGARVDSAQLCAGLDGRVAGGPGRRVVTLVRQHDAEAHEAIRPPDLIVSCLSLVGHRAKLCCGSARSPRPSCAIPRYQRHRRDVEPVTDRVGEIASLLGGRSRRDRVTDASAAKTCATRIWHEPPPIVQIPGQAHRLGQVRARRLCVEVGGDIAARGERPRQQGRVVDLAGDRQGVLGLMRALGVAHPEAERGPIGQRPRPHGGRHPRLVRVKVGQGGVEPGPGLPAGAPAPATAAATTTPAPRPDLDVGVFPAPRERRTQVVDLGFGLLDALLIITVCRERRAWRRCAV